MAKKDKEAKKVLERTYNVPLRREWLKVPKYKRAKKASKALKQFIEKHMKSQDVRILKYANEEIWKKGMKSPPHHIKVNAVKDEKGKVLVELFGKEIKEEKPDTQTSKSESDASKEKKEKTEKKEKKTEKEEKLEEKRKETVDKEAEEGKKIEKEEIKEEKKEPQILPHPKAAELKQPKQFKSDKPDYRAPKGSQGIAKREHHHKTERK